MPIDWGSRRRRGAARARRRRPRDGPEFRAAGRRTAAGHYVPFTPVLFPISRVDL